MLLLRPLRQTSRVATAALSASTTRACAQRSSNVAPSFRRTYAARGAPAVFPTIDTCPSPTCSCAPTPSFPEGFEIDHTTPLNGLMPNHAQQVLICTGKDDWPSKIEDDDNGQNHAAMLRDLIGRGGPYSDPFHNISVLNVSFPPSSSPSSASSPADQEATNTTAPTTTSIYLLPDFKYIPSLSSDPNHVKALVKAHLLPEKLHPVHNHSPPAKREALLRDPSYADMLPGGVRDIRNEVIVLICGHGGRDQRCGVYGPLLRSEFETRLAEQGQQQQQQGPGIEVLKGAAEKAVDLEKKKGVWGARVGLISHIGGHKFAGNVIVYIPPGLKSYDDSDVPHPLAGHGIWYGRVEPKHVEGIVKETIKKGNVIKELFRGGIKQGGEILRLPL
ncbi:Sucrase/ferredoxin-like-domain-containing protein [Neurospora hispaniola]|uniref:Altered inheritance of mitochondria protein 32 n=1 Tax=Neurospora hispaniola TaxID=588809 RepID=A0AAJ0IFB6_9PEZI|nr:Sucrase/ferredoxin-like-domain-containing protein [Neurospora hispaniola]